MKIDNPADPNPDLSVMIALLPTTTDWCKIKLPHLTLVYAGIIKDLKTTDFNELAKAAKALALKFKPITLNVMGVKIFGDVDKVSVLRLRSTPELTAMRRSVQSWNASDFPFNPHATIGPAGTADKKIPTTLTFDRISVVWGTKKMTFLFEGLD